MDQPQHIVSIDKIELHSRKVVRMEAGEGSSSHDRPAIIMEERFRRLTEAGAQTREVKVAKIQKVIFLLRDHKHFMKYFEPKVASLGPIHHDNPKYKLGEGYKLILASKFVQDSGKSINNLYDEAEKEIKQLRECFEEEVTKKYDDEALAWMLFVDGCAILEYIFCATNHDKFKELNIKNDSVTFAQQDLFLLENQVPYRLLELLMSLSEKKDELRKSIDRFIGIVPYQQTEPQQRQAGDQSSVSQPKPTHLLDLLRTTLLGSDPPRSSKPDLPAEKATRFRFCGKQKAKERISTTEVSNPQQSSKPDPPSRETCRIWPCRKTRRMDPDDWQSYRNVQELKASGIQLKRSANSHLRNISFSRRCGLYPGYLWLPPIIVDDSTSPKFMNLIAYEMCLDFKNDFGISSYISFLDSLIDEATDVKDLRKARILHNFLGSDQEVAELFNEIGTDLVPNTETYKDVKVQIQEYYETRWMTYMAQVRHDHFSSPWTILAFVGILFALLLSLTQTWFAAHPPPGPCDDLCKKLASSSILEKRY